MEENKKLDDFIKASIKDIGLEKPSVDFTELVLSKIEADTQMNAVRVYKPLFSKMAWFVLVTVVASIFGYAIFSSPEVESSWFTLSQIDKLITSNLTAKISVLAVSNTYVYGFLMVTLFLCVHVILLKQRFDKQYRLQ